jgi:hypothetical protein
MKGFLRIFLLSHFEYCQNWLNILMHDTNLSNITKLKKLKIKNFKKKTLILGSNSSLNNPLSFAMNICENMNLRCGKSS